MERSPGLLSLRATGEPAETSRTRHPRKNRNPRFLRLTTICGDEGVCGVIDYRMALAKLSTQLKGYVKKWKVEVISGSWSSAASIGWLKKVDPPGEYPGCT